VLDKLKIFLREHAAAMEHAPTFFFALLAILTLSIAVLGFKSSTQAKKIQALQSEIGTLRQRFKEVCVPPNQFLGLAWTEPEWLSEPGASLFIERRTEVVTTALCRIEYIEPHECQPCSEKMAPCAGTPNLIKWIKIRRGLLRLNGEAANTTL
jgi:hypothetical protein